MMTNSMLSAFTCLKVFIAHYRHKPLQAGAILLGIVLAVTLLTGVKATNENARRSYTESTELLSRQAAGYILPATGLNSLDESQYFLLRQSGISSLAILEGAVIDEQGRRWKVTGSDLISAMTFTDTAQDASLFDKIPLADLLAGQPIALMSQSMAQKIAPSGQLSLRDYQIQVIALDDSVGLGNQILLDVGFAQILLNKAGRLSYIALMTENGISETEQSRINALLLGTNQLQIADDGAGLVALTDSFHFNLRAMGMLAFVVGLFIAYNGIRYSLMKRQQLMLKLLQLGMSRQSLMSALLMELLLLVHIGSLLGFILGLQLSQWLQPMITMTLEQLYGARLLPGHWQFHWLLEAVTLTLAAALLACVPLYHSLTKQSLARSGHVVNQNLLQHASHKWQFILGSGLTFIIVLLFPLTEHHRQSLLLIGLLTLTIPLLLPQLTLWMLTLLAALMPRGLWHYLVAETRELTAPLALAMMAMFLALSANIAMNTLVSSFEQTLKNWLDNQLHADLYIRPNPVDVEQVEKALQQQKSISDVHYQWEAYSQFKLPISAHAVATPSGSYQEKIMLLARDQQAMLMTVSLKAQQLDFWPTFFNGNSVMISEPLAIRHQLDLGDLIYVQALADLFPEGIPIAGIYYDYGKPLGEVMISRPLWFNAGLPANSRNFAVSYQGDIDELEANLQQAGLAPAIMFSQKRVKAQAMSMFSRTFSITQVLNSLTLLVAAIGLFSACMMLMQARQAPIARLYALGVSRPQLRIMVSTQMLLIVLFTALLALPVGALMGWLLIHKVTLQAFGWTIQMLWDWRSFVSVVLMALGACALAVILPLYQQVRKPLMSSLQQEVI